MRMRALDETGVEKAGTEFDVVYEPGGPRHLFLAIDPLDRSPDEFQLRHEKSPPIEKGCAEIRHPAVVF